MERRIRAAHTAVDAAGGPAKMARQMLDKRASERQLDLLQRRISKWKVNGIPPLWVLKVEEVSGVPRHVLRPDLYPCPVV